MRVYLRSQIEQTEKQKDAQVFEATSSHYVEGRDTVYDESPLFMA